MANVIGNYDMTFYAREALRWLKEKKGVVRLTNRRIEGERNGAGMRKGSVVQIRRPAKFTAAAFVEGTGTTNQDINAQNINVTVDQDYETKFNVSDREIAFGGRELVMEHIGPAVDSIAKQIESTVYTLGQKIGPSVTPSGTSAEKVIVEAREVLARNLTPMDDNIFFAIDESLEAVFLKDPIFHQAQIVGQGNQSALMDAMLGRRFGTNIFTSQLAKRDIAQQTATLAAAAGTGDEVGAIDNAPDGYPVNTSSGIVIDALTNAETLSPNVDTFTIAGDPTTYMVTAVSGAVASNEITISCYPPLQQPAADNAVVTFNNRSSIQDAAAGTRENLMFHRDALAVVMAPLAEEGNGRGAEVVTVTDDETGLSLQLRRWYEGGTGRNFVAVRALWGVQALNTQMAVRVLRAKP